jgi:rubrerythrin
VEIDRLLKPLHRWVWLDAHRRARKLLRFAETEADGCRDLARAAELTGDPLLRRLYLRHAQDEALHADLFRARGRTLLAAMPHRGTGIEADWISPGERGLDDVDVEGQREGTLLAFLHLSEKAAAARFAIYAEVLDRDPGTRAVFERVLQDEAFHMAYTRKQLARLSPRKQGVELWKARASRIWKAYLRIAIALASAIGFVILTVQYFIVLPPFALLARRRRDPEGLVPARAATPLESQY